MEKKIIIVFCFLALTLNAQKNTITKINYSMSLNLDKKVTNNSELFFSNSSSYYIEGVYDYDSGNDEIKNEETKKGFKKIYHNNLKKDSIFMKDKLGDNIVIVSEKTSKINWQIEYDKKGVILGFNCLRAKGKFRGRIYTVWFTPDIPVSFGPWKLQGLPGLILEANDYLNQVQFIAQKLEYTSSNIDYLKDKNLFKKLTLKEYVSEIDKDIKKKVEQIISKLPRNSKVSNLSFKEYRGIELEYE